MSIPPVPNHPPRPGRRKPAEESPDSITTQLFVGQTKSAAADGSTQALSSADLERLRSQISADGAEATEVLSLDELRQIAASTASTASSDISEEAPSATPRKAKSADIAEASAASAPKQWNPQAQTHYPGFGAADGSRPPNLGGPLAGQRPRYEGPEQASPVPEYAAAGGYPGGPGGRGPGHGGPGYGGPVGPGGRPPGGGYERDSETKKVPAWLWVLASIALVAALGIVGYIAWDSLKGNETITAGQTEQPTEPGGETSGPASSSPPAASESFSSPSGNISCTIDSERVRCVIAAYDYQPPDKPADCQATNWGSVVVANDDGAGFSCREAPATEGPTRVLGYGESVSAEGITCTSTEEGMNCLSDSTGIGFQMRRAGVQFLD